MTDATYLRPETRGVVAVGGPDARTFLQGVITQDAAAVTPKASYYGAMLSAQGRLLWDFFMAEADGRLLLECDREGIAAFAKKLSMYKLRSKAEVADVSADFAVLLFPGRAALDALDLAATPGAARPWHGGVLYVDPRLADMGARAMVAADKVDEAIAETGFAEGAEDDYVALRLSLGVPEGSVDLPPEQALPMEVGFDELNALSWSKGCYMGQELTARMRYRALIKKRLVPVAIDGPAPAPGTPVVFDGKEAGEMRSSSGDRGLAYLRLEAMHKAEAAARPLEAGAARLTPLRPDWIELPEAEEKA